MRKSNVPLLIALVLVPAVIACGHRCWRACYPSPCIQPCLPPPCVQQEKPKVEKEPELELLPMPHEEDGGISLPGAYSLSGFTSPYQDGLLFSSTYTFTPPTIPWEPIPPYFGGGCPPGGHPGLPPPHFPPDCHHQCDDHHNPLPCPPPHVTTPAPPSLVLAGIGMVIVAGSHGYRRWRSARS